MNFNCYQIVILVIVPNVHFIPIGQSIDSVYLKYIKKRITN
jgi:hypothetical protein